MKLTMVSDNIFFSLLNNIGLKSSWILCKCLKFNSIVATVSIVGMVADLAGHPPSLVGDPTIAMGLDLAIGTSACSDSEKIQN